MFFGMFYDRNLFGVRLGGMDMVANPFEVIWPLILDRPINYLAVGLVRRAM